MKISSNEPVKLKKARRPLVLAIDIGTSSTRALVYDALGRPVKKLMMQIGYTMTTTRDGGVVADPRFIVNKTAECIDAVMAALGERAGDVKAVGFDTFWHNVMGVDRAGKPTTPLINWADTRPREVVAELREKIDPAASHARTGCVIHPSYLPAKIVWFHKRNRDAFRKTRKWMSIGEYLYLVFFGKTVCGLSMASGTGLLNQNTCRWDEGVFAALPVTPNDFPELGDLDTPLSGLLPAYARRWPALARIPWLPAVGDGASSNVGTGCVDKEQLCLVMGTSGAMRVCWEAESVEIPPELWVYRVDRKRFLMGGALSDGGNLRKWLCGQLGIEGKKGIDAALKAVQPDAHGLTVLPFWAGERSTGWHEHARGLLTGLNLNTSREEIVRGALEALCFRYAAIYEVFKKANRPVKQAVASGGGFIDSAILTQIMADVLGITVTQSGEAEGSARGAAVLALEAIGAIKHASSVPMPLGKSFRPNPALQPAYARARERQQRLYDLVAKQWWEKPS